jgi:hypothetical protein
MADMDFNSIGSILVIISPDLFSHAGMADCVTGITHQVGQYQTFGARQWYFMSTVNNFKRKRIVAQLSDNQGISGQGITRRINDFDSSQQF